MNDRTTEMLAWVDGQQERLLTLVRDWAGIGSWSLDPVGLARMHEALTTAWAPLGPVERLSGGTRTTIGTDGRPVTAPLGDALRLVGGAEGGTRVLLCIHMDTVHPPGSEPRVELAEGGRILRGPGVADAKGGLAVMLVALEAFARFGTVERLRWEVLVNADEEVGSPGSLPLLTAAAARNDVGLLFEPALDERGTLAGARKGSGNFTVVVRGRAAHAGRHLADGRNAVIAAARLATACDGLNARGHGAAFNVAALHGGEAYNVVPDLAVVRINVRAVTDADAAWAASRMEGLVAAEDRRGDVTAELHGGFHGPPKPFRGGTFALFERIVACGHRLGLTLEASPTGGACDGNKLAADGLPNVDTLGVRGGGIHGPDEYLVIESLGERARLAALVLEDLAIGGPPCT